MKEKKCNCISCQNRNEEIEDRVLDIKYNQKHMNNSIGYQLAAGVVSNPKAHSVEGLSNTLNQIKNTPGTELGVESARLEGDCEKLLQSIRHLTDRIDLILVPKVENKSVDDPSEVIPLTELGQFIRNQSGKIEYSTDLIEKLIGRIQL